MKGSKIAWCHDTFNPWWGCTEVGPECDNCYARAFAKRTGHAVWGLDAGRRLFGAKHWNEPIKWNREAEADGLPRRVFCASMADVFETPGGVTGDALRGERKKLWALIDATPALTWLLLTKRPGNIVKCVPEGWRMRVPGNVWLGTTAGTRRTWDTAIPQLLRAPDAEVKFVSCEPLLEDLGAVDLAGIQWLICGGESTGGRPCAEEWLLDLVDRCKRAGVPAFVKQLGSYVVSTQRVDLDGKWAWRAGTANRAGADPSEWPDYLRVREWPDA